MSGSAAESSTLVGLRIQWEKAFGEEVVGIGGELVEGATLVLGRGPPRIHLLLENASFVRLEIVLGILDLLHVGVMRVDAPVVALGTLLSQHFFVRLREEVRRPPGILKALCFSGCNSLIIGTFDQVDAVNLGIR